jgi:hypothetical protein
MAVSADKPGPYTSPKVIIDLISRHRSRGLPSPVDVDVLTRAGVTESMTARTMQSLYGLDLIAEDGSLTEVFEGLRLAPEGEFKSRLKEWLDAAYADVLQFVDPSKDGEVAVRDAFRNYKPVGQQDRMVTLFIRLYEAAGVGTAKSDTERVRSRPSVVRRPPPKTSVKFTGGGAPRSHSTGVGGGANYPAAIAGLLQSLPAEGDGWTKAKRDSFLTAFGVVLDFCFQQVSEAEATADAIIDEEG